MTDRLGLFVVVFVLLVACEKERYGPQPDATLGHGAMAQKDPERTGQAAAPGQVLDRSRMRAGDWVEYRSSSSATFRDRTVAGKGRVRITVARAEGGAGIVRVQALEGGTGDLWIRLSSWKPEGREWRLARSATRTEKRAAAGRNWAAQIRSYDLSATDGPRGELVFAFDAPELAVSGGVLSWHESGGGPGGYGGSDLDLVAFGHAEPPVLPAALPKTLSDADLPALLGQVLTQEISADEGY